ncbi:MAG: DUF362 domain-containing protein [Desulfobacterales bacterium]|jgi:hypothetical protein
MKKSKRVITRRDFIRTSSYLAMGSLITLPLVDRSATAKSDKSRVVLIRDKRVMDGSGVIRSESLADMMNEAMTTLFNTSSVAAAWQQLFGPTDVVGIKSNVWGPLHTPRELESILQQHLLAAGVKARNISVDDRGVRRNPIFKKSTALINVRPMRTHHWSGLGTLLKNYIMFSSQPWMYHGNACEKLGMIWRKSPVKGKTRLNILVMLTPLFHGVGPHHYSKSYIWPYCGLVVSTDPVAADTTGAGIIQAKRNEYFEEKRAIRPRPLHIEAADVKYGLGNSQPARIDLIKLGWEEGVLV